MISDWMNQDVLVIGLGARGRAACEWLRGRGARVFGVDSTDTAELRAQAARLESLGVQITLGARRLPQLPFNLTVLSPAAPANVGLERTAANSGPWVGELELGFQHARCLTIAIAGTNGKSSTAGLVERLLVNNHRRAVVAGHCARPVFSVVEQTPELDFLLLQVNAGQLERTEFFRPAVSVLLNLAPDQLDRFPTAEQYIRANANLFRNQQPFDWAILQTEALAKLRQFELPVPAKVITFSATDTEADIFLDRGLLISRLPNWPGPLLDMAHCRVRGPHQAENLMAALAVGRALRLSLEEMLEPLKTAEPGPHRGRIVAEIGGVEYVDDAKCANPHALTQALLAIPPRTGGAPNIFLIAGGRDVGHDFHQVGPVLARRVKAAFLFGEAAEKIRAAWSLFTPCHLFENLIDAVESAAKSVTAGEVVLFSPACSSLDQFPNYEKRGEMFCQKVKSIGVGAAMGDPYRQGAGAE